jgi:hypothetical protein
MRYLESEDEAEKKVKNEKKQNFKENLYIGYLILGTITFVLGIYISYKKIKSGE